MIGLTMTGLSIFAGLFLVNAIFLIWVRAPFQAKSFPRSVVSLLSVPTRWLYPDTGRSNSANDIALIGDSYVEGDGDGYSISGDYDYSVGHHLHKKTSLPFGVYAASGTYLPTSMSFFEAGMQGKLWPLFDRRPLADRPASIWLFFYEGNDLDDFIAARDSGHPSVSDSLPWRVKLSPMRFYLQRRWMLRNSAPMTAHPSEALVNEVCTDNGCELLPRLQSASPTLAPREIEEAIGFIAMSVMEFARRHEGSSICFFYIPSPATIYALKTTESFDVSSGDVINVKKEDNAKKSLVIRSGFKHRFAGSGLVMIDLTEKLQQFAGANVLHGSVDADHFNSFGYEAFADAVLDQGEQCLPDRSN